MDYTKVYYIRADLHPTGYFVISFSAWSYIDTPKKVRTNHRRVKTFPIASDSSMNSFWYRKNMNTALFYTDGYMQRLVRSYSKRFERYGWVFKHNSIEFSFYRTFYKVLNSKFVKTCV